jgi:SAM-dependent methyltransferase
MTQHWHAQQDCLEIFAMPFYWRLSESQSESVISSRLPIRIQCVQAYDYLEYRPTPSEWHAINTAYQQDANIGFLNPESGQMNTYGSSVNRFFLSVLKDFPFEKIYEIGCGAGFSIQYAAEHGFKVTGIDPSEYSLRWSERLGFDLLNTFFDETVIAGQADLIFCNDVFEHVPQVDQFCRAVYQSLKPGGVFCFSTTNSSGSIALGDISMLEHQHVNMFTEQSIYLLLQQAGFSDVSVGGGSYGNTFQVIAKKHNGVCVVPSSLPVNSCQGYFERTQRTLTRFNNFYQKIGHTSHYYVPLRCIPYLATVGNFGESDVYDSNKSWQGKYIDGYGRPIKSISDLHYQNGETFFIGSVTFYNEIKKTLMEYGYPERSIYSISSLGDFDE